MAADCHAPTRSPHQRKAAVGFRRQQSGNLHIDLVLTNAAKGHQQQQLAAEGSSRQQLAASTLLWALALPLPLPGPRPDAPAGGHPEAVPLPSRFDLASAPGLSCSDGGCELEVDDIQELVDLPAS
eukprot:CAMPEP_0172898184 /NCGR_PEP_ID=MMETSP1075-20121228/159163_1 /TAXON_ID=2916 /ORGANISM="Ceratium fusus, Strain PA161109" /LENGTH=125 /DNA_ID=CAMNT_0013753921 /DNA_START=413 /DNA_END=786 /DNA_ORIENTATION=-